MKYVLLALTGYDVVMNIYYHFWDDISDYDFVKVRAKIRIQTHALILHDQILISGDKNVNVRS